MTNLKTLTAALCVVTLSAGVPFAVAQSAGGTAGQQYGAPTEAASAPVTDEELEKFVAAEQKVNEIRQKLTEELGNAGDQQEAQQMQLDAQEEMVEAIKDEEMDIPRYNEIASRMQTDMELRQRAQQIN
ncbi:DUF4168 domain-containing protein [Halopseudomonas maritima]|uniref:DUF4168 domain-containing protein n=1 Tax=Halopseudomonas maritima TaxID=2918528 RepID=UPI001EEAC509|nr:DUF4168 domain-containing protein [Halopseudomonas maritima]UJJ31034.1 DUF4168 domain-containing protein [Halopseudomonas maritima]